MHFFWEKRKKYLQVKNFCERRLFVKFVAINKYLPLINYKMIEIATLATTTVTALVPFLTKGGEELTKGAAGDLWKWVKSKFSEKGKENALQVLENKPDDAKQQGKVEGVLEDILTEKTDLLAELTALLTAAKAEQINTTNNTATVTGNNNNVFQGLNNSNVNIGNTHQHHSGTGDLIGGDKIINNNAFYGNRPVSPEKGEVWKRMLTENKIADAIEYLLKEYATDADKNNTLLLLLGQYNFNESNMNKGIISHSDATLTRNKVANSLLQMFG